MDEIEQTLAEIDRAIAAGDQMMALAKMHPLSQETETAPFLFFLMGDSLTQISDKTGIPKETLALTARSLNWLSRRDAFARDGRSVPVEILRNLVNMLAVTSYMAIEKELKMVMSGERDPAHCKFIPKNVNALQTLMQMLASVNEIKTKDPKGKGPAPVSITAENVQVNMNGPVPEAKPTTKADLLKAMADANAEPERKEE